MISAFFDVLRPFLSLCFLALCVLLLAKAVDVFSAWDERRVRARHARRMFVGNLRERPPDTPST